MATAIILARGGSQGIKDKNLKRIGGVSLIMRAVYAAKTATDDVYVSTDHPEIMIHAENAGATVVTRPPELAGPDVHGDKAILHAVKKIGLKKGVILSVQATSYPHYEDDIRAVMDAVEAPDFESAMTVEPIYTPIWQRDPSGLGTQCIGKNSPPRQEAIPVYTPNGGAYAVKAEHFLETKSFVSGRVKLVIASGPQVDIDTPEDLWLARNMYLEGRR